MNVSLSWDLFVIVFFALVVTYTFILGRSEAIKMIVATYIAIIAVQGISSALGRLDTMFGGLLKLVGLGSEVWMLTVAKIVLFIAIVIFFTIRAGIEINYKKEPTQLIALGLTLLFGIATGGLILTTLMTYATGVPLMEMNLASVKALGPIVEQSEIMQFMISNQDLWFTAPAVLLAAVGFTHNQE
jgi:hypothetical protein